MENARVIPNRELEAVAERPGRTRGLLDAHHNRLNILRRGSHRACVQRWQESGAGEIRAWPVDAEAIKHGDHRVDRPTWCLRVFFAILLRAFAKVIQSSAVFALENIRINIF